jgi:hypothetical protein
MYGRFFLVVLSLFLLLASAFFRNVSSHAQETSLANDAETACPDTVVPVMQESGTVRLVQDIPSYCRRRHPK